MNKSAIFISMYFFTAGIAYANGTDKFTTDAIAEKSVQELKVLQSDFKTAIDEQIGQAICAEDSQCQALAMGANPCGGPESYVAYSTVETDVAQLSELAAQYKLVRQALHVKTGTMGACIVIPEPTLRCENQRCIAIQKQNILMF